MRHSPILVAALAWLGTLVAASGQMPAHPSLLRNHHAISYSSAPVTDPVARLNEAVQRGESRLEFNASNGYLESVLRALRVPVESQILVFSKTSFQAPKINPANPRAIFFNDQVSVGWVRGGDVLELVAQDAKQGAIFYTLAQTPGGRPAFARNDSCVMCHASEATENVPGMFVGSVFPGRDGTTMYGPAYTTDHRSPFELRWGGWFVNGRHGASRHMGNAIATDPSDLAAMVTPQTVHVESLRGRFEMTGYPSPHSDLVALLVLEHQARMANLITRLGWEARIGKDASRPLAEAAAELVDYMLFVDEAPLPGPIAGPSPFARTFSAGGPRDRKGRSLRELDLGDRLTRYPCSFLIYSEPFGALPDAARQAVYDRLRIVLAGADPAPRYAPLTRADRQAVLEILDDTLADDLWKEIGETY